MPHITVEPSLSPVSCRRCVGSFVGSLLAGVLGCSASDQTTAYESSTAETTPATTPTTATSAATEATTTTATPTTGGSASASGGSSGSETSTMDTPPTTTATASTGDASTGDPSTGTSTTASSSSSGGEVCIDRGGSCAAGERCCDGLDCCIGIPVPRGEEFCSEMCPKSDRNSKTDIRPVDSEQVLQRVVQLPISTWRYRGDQPEVRHLGPMAQDFHATFGLWDNDTKIFALDASGVALAAIQGLYDRVHNLEEENAALRTRLDRLEQRSEKLAPRAP